MIASGSASTIVGGKLTVCCRPWDHLRLRAVFKLFMVGITSMDGMIIAQQLVLGIAQQAQPVLWLLSPAAAWTALNAH